MRPHAFARCRLGRGIRNEVRGALQRKRATRGVDVRSPRLQIVKTFELAVHPLERRREDLLALRRMLGGSRKACSAPFLFSAHLTPLLPAERLLLSAHLAQAGSQVLQLGRLDVINGRMVRAADRFVFVVAEEGAFAL